MSKANSMFLANVKKYLALAILWQEEGSCIPDIQHANAQRNRILMLLEAAHSDFESSGSEWGMAVTDCMAGYTYNQFVHKQKASEFDEQELTQCEALFSEGLHLF